MQNYLLDEDGFDSLKRYIDFLGSLSPALKEITNYTALIARSGHKMLLPPDALLLEKAGQANNLAWQAIKISVPMLGSICRDSIVDARLFIDEFRALTQDEQVLRSKIADIDPMKFTLAKLPGWGAGMPGGVGDLMIEVGRRLAQSETAIKAFEQAVISIGTTLHNIFVRFIESLSIHLCSCHEPITKIESYYAVGKIDLPDMEHDPNRNYSQEERKQNARLYLARLNNIRASAASAVDNLTDFCYRLQYLLALSQSKLTNNHPSSTWARSNALLTMAEGPLLEVSDMSDQLLVMSGKLV
ncbi:hypothetical protein J3D47_005428 [Pseudomonas laurylsulfativorans]|uniref:hypothetical protein n=1 Tax=Pseudomonas laurylsulfativorans TaxID=1943631 RepID=UPI00209D52A1|nr:hypothetical protein [Pseudomonas laurylsulfativorans]MCP1421185.1 hypothetical protein [Pseudomonas laurylsulfativorans]